MGYSGKLREKLLAQKLRQEGLSYKEILLRVPVSKDTISRWCKNIELTQDQKKRLLNNKLYGQKKGSMVAAENKKKIREKQVKEALEKGKKEVGSLTKRDRFLTGIALYAGEGDKTDGKGGFANADPKLIKFMMSWLREFSGLPNNRFHGALWIHEGLSTSQAMRFWSRVTGIPISRFYKTYVVENKKDSNKIRKIRHEFGVFAIRFSDVAAHRQIMGWISGVFHGKINSIPR